MANQDPSKIVLHACTEGGQDVQDVTWGDLTAQVRKVSDAMKYSGVKVGDRVAGVLSNRVETVVACLATLSIGALWSTSSPDMGVSGILDRIEQIRPKLLFVESDVFYNGKLQPQMAKNRAYTKPLLHTSEFSNMIVIPRKQKVLSKPELKLITWDEFLKRDQARELHFARLPFSHPGFIVYSSGTVPQLPVTNHAADCLY